MLVDYVFGRFIDHLSHQEYSEANTRSLMSVIEVSKLLSRKFIGRYGGILCPQIQIQLYGRTYYLLDQDDIKEFERAGGYDDPRKCCQVVGNTARWVMKSYLIK